MRAIRLHAHGDASALVAESTPIPSPAPGEVLVRVAHAGVNFIDVYRRTGLYKVPLPTTLGEEGAGVVEALGEGVSGLALGDRVAWASHSGSYAEFIAVPAGKLVKVPAGVELRLAAAVMLQGMTAHYLARSTCPLQPGDRALVHAAAGGVGLLLVQMAKKLGAFVVGTAGSDDKVALARAAGADAVINYRTHDFAAETLRATGGQRLRVVYDSVGKDTYLAGFDLLQPRGMVVLYGQSSGVVPPIDPLLLSQKGSLFLTRPSLGHYLLTPDELAWRAGDLFDAVAAGSLDVRVGAEFELERAGDAHRALEGRATTGKVLLRV